MNSLVLFRAKPFPRQMALCLWLTHLEIELGE
jgi:hypothetical protein